MRFHDIIELASQSTSIQQNTLTDGNFACTYQEMPKLIEQIGAVMQGHGISHGDCIAYECENSVPGAIALLGLYALQHAFVLLPPTDDSSALVLKPIPHFCRFRIRIAPTHSRGDLAEPSLQPGHFLQIEENPHYNGLNVQGAHKQHEGIVYLRTSGSMGTSKITVHSHQRLLGNALNCVERFGLEATDRVFIPVPIFHMYGLGAGFLPAIAAGTSIDLQEKTNILRYLDRERKFNPNVAYLTPTLCEMLLQGRKADRAYKRVVTATQRIKEETFYQFDAQFGGLVNLYGSTELGAIATSVPSDPVEQRATTIKPMAHVVLSIESDDVGLPNGSGGSTSSEALSLGAQSLGAQSLGALPLGPLHCQHATGFTGYVDEEGEWIQRLAPTDWYETGDVAKKNQDGTFQIVGRAKNSVNRSGYLVLFADVERAMEKMDNIEQVIVVEAKGESRQGQRIAAFCLPATHAKNGSTPDGTEIRNQCLDLLPKYAVPDDVQVIETFPALPNGKVDRQMLMTMVGG